VHAFCAWTGRRQPESVLQSDRSDAVIHLASLLPAAGRVRPREAADVNVLGGANLLDAAGRFGVRRIVCGSSISVYGSGHEVAIPYGPEEKLPLVHVEAVADMLVGLAEAGQSAA
jgi:nucleoside-diphosphate-sugar epimerase